jgi:hypothetical protein
LIACMTSATQNNTVRLIALPESDKLMAGI